MKGGRARLNVPITAMNTKKKMIFLSLFFAFTLLLPTSSIAKAEDTSFVGAATVYEGQRGRTVKVNLYIHGSEKIAGGSLNLLYDKSALTIQKVELGDSLTDYMSSVNEDQAGKVSLTWAKAVGQMQEGTLLTITARLAKPDETIALDLQDVQLFSENFSSITVETFDGAVKPFKGEAKKHESKVKRDKEWNIRLNKAFNLATVNKHTVLVKDSRGNEIAVNINMRNSETFTVSPKSNYVSGTYTLEITEQVQALNGTKLKQPVRYEFTVE